MKVNARGNRGIMKATTNKAIEYSLSTNSGSIPIAKYETVSQKEVNIRSAKRFWKHGTGKNDITKYRNIEK
jgi:hypothetical protein